MSVASDDVPSGGAECAEQWPQHRVDEVMDDCMQQRWERVASALEAGFPVNAKGGRRAASIVNWAALHGNVPILRRVLAEGASVNNDDDFGQTPAHYAAVCGRVDALAVLVEAGADVNARDSHLQTPLFHAVYSSLPCTRYLLSLPEVDLSAKNVHEETADMYATKMQRPVAAEAVLAEVRVCREGGRGRGPTVRPHTW